MWLTVVQLPSKYEANWSRRSKENATPPVEKWPKLLFQHLMVFFTAFFSVMGKKFWNQIWIPQTIFYKVILTPSIYHAIWRHNQWFSDYFSFFHLLHQISQAKKHDTGHSDQRSRWLWVNIRIWDEFRATAMLITAVCKFWHFFFCT